MPVVGALSIRAIPGQRISMPFLAITKVQTNEGK